MLQEGGMRGSNRNQDQDPQSSDSRPMYPWDEEHSGKRGFADTFV